MTITNFNLCKGPKQKDCATFDVKMVEYNILKYDIQILKNMLPNRGKVISKKDGVEILRFQMKKPCDHLFFGPLFHALMNVSNECVIQKGHYKFQADIQKIAQNYWANSFLFGNWTFKSYFYNNECNLYCSVIEAIIFSNKAVF